MNTPYERWLSGNFAFPGGFELRMFEAYRHASGTNRALLELGFPEFFVKQSEPPKKDYLKEGIGIVHYLNELSSFWHFSLGGSVLTKENPNDIDIIVNHADDNKMGRVEAIVELLEEKEYLCYKQLNGMHNINFRATKEGFKPLHIIIYT
jgi:hypothetical protein